MIVTKTKEELEIMRRAALMVSKTLGMIAAEIKPGVTTLRLDELAETYIRDNGAIPGFKGLYDCPSTLLISPNEEVVHGIPKDVPIKEGDILSVDCGAIVDGFYGDHAYTFAVGEIPKETQLLLERTKNSLYIGIDKFRLGNRVGDVGHAIQEYCEGFGYGVVRELVGHGIGAVMHEDPQMPNYGKRGRGKKFIEGMTVAIEPMINMGTKSIQHYPDGWTIKTKDKKPSAHFEHDVALVDGEPRLLSTFDYIYEVLGITSNEEDPYRWKE
ncbi:type I methionyl aminopeptidase [Nonlabens ponticola]|uniref:Methionine aminopeptidase n=1 Tax=Nonlabens ponticola TaxID=2496866 RepID=A0A3S9MUC1_9FLAO|nr:type I methionyl aminopeptidase [Nonlabens ponticola]AZQ42768.1 type I methionyl aminopeptidase [Nonlabens ponticola]